MSHATTPPFARGTTFYNAYATASIPSSNTGHKHLLGFEYTFENYSPSVDGNKLRTKIDGSAVKGRIAENASGITLLPKRGVQTSTTNRNEVTGYSRLESGKFDGVVDDQLPSAGVRDGDIFWLLTDGPVLCTTDPAGGANNVITAGDIMVALTAAASTHSTTSGRVYSFVITSNATYAVSASMNRIGTALSAKTTAQSDGDVLVDLSINWN